MPLPDWITIQNPANKANLLVLEIVLDKGEASAIALAMEHSWCLLQGRKMAKQLGITITGTLGLLAEAKTKGYVPLVKPLLEKIKQTNFRLNEHLENAILKKVGE